MVVSTACASYHCLMALLWLRSSEHCTCVVRSLGQLEQYVIACVFVDEHTGHAETMGPVILQLDSGGWLLCDVWLVFRN